MERKPIKRSQHLVALSKDHHFTLLFCWKIRNGLKRAAGAERIVKYVAYFWQHHLQPHFNAEETILFTLPENAMVQRAVNEHRQIATAISNLKTTGPDAEAELFTLADLVDDHVRYEERELFPHLEKVLSEEQLNAIKMQLNALHAVPAKDEFDDEFWMP